MPRELLLESSRIWGVLGLYTQIAMLYDLDGKTGRYERLFSDIKANF